MNFIDLTGKRFGRGVVLRRDGIYTSPKGDEKITWRVACDCGREFVAHGASLRRGLTKSCGCLEAESRIGRNKKHGESWTGQFTAEYRAWKAMKTRCYNSKVRQYHRYGGRGVAVCDRWLHSYENFLADMGRRPSPNHSVDRINNNGNYEPGNCRWATRSQQCSNTVRSWPMKLNGQQCSLTGLAEALRIRRGSLYKRLNGGWGIFCAAMVP